MSHNENGCCNLFAASPSFTMLQLLFIPTIHVQRSADSNSALFTFAFEKTGCNLVFKLKYTFHLCSEAVASRVFVFSLKRMDDGLIPSEYAQQNLLIGIVASIVHAFTTHPSLEGGSGDVF